MRGEAEYKKAVKGISSETKVLNDEACCDALHHQNTERPCLSLWERWPRSGRRGSQAEGLCRSIEKRSP